TRIIHSAKAGNLGCIYWPKGINPIITINAAINSKVASRLLALNARYAADAI
ncbi:unnamed protein product, partial [marine sediment metagenome]